MRFCRCELLDTLNGLSSRLDFASKALNIGRPLFSVNQRTLLRNLVGLGHLAANVVVLLNKSEPSRRQPIPARPSKRPMSRRRLELARDRRANDPNLPKHVHHCHARGARDWWIWTWKKGMASVKTRCPYKCNSWRCEHCRTHEAHVAWTRMRDAFMTLDASGMVFLVLTLDRYGTYSGEQKWKNAQAAYRDLSNLSTLMMRGLRKWMKRQGWTVLQNQWVSTIEMHKSGWPHANYVIYSPELAAWLEEEKQAKMRGGISESDTRYISGELADIITDAGWGLMSTAERARSRDESLGYICKLAGKAEESLGEIAKMTQLPLAAPFRFRRIRSGVGFLPPRKKNELVTGTLVRRQYSHLGYDVLPLHAIKGDEAIANCENCCANEERIWFAELEAAHRGARQVKRFGMSAVEVPPVTRWVNGVRLAYTVQPRNHDDATNDLLFGREEILRQCSWCRATRVRKQKRGWCLTS
jgi:hypothetical protein